MKTANKKNEMKLKVTYTDKHSSHFNYWHDKVTNAAELKTQLNWMIDEYQAVICAAQEALEGISELEKGEVDEVVTFVEEIEEELIFKTV